MNSLSKVFLLIWLVCTGIVAWAASIPNPYPSRAQIVSAEGEIVDPGLPPDNEYYWIYIIFILAIGLLTFFVTWPLKRPTVLRWICGAVISLVACGYLLWGAMHTPPVHIYLIFITLATAVFCIFTAGYSLGIKKAI